MGSCSIMKAFSSCYLQGRHDGVHQLPLQVGSVSELSLVVVEGVVQVGDRSVCRGFSYHTELASLLLVKTLFCML